MRNDKIVFSDGERRYYLTSPESYSLAISSLNSSHAV